MCRFDPKCCLLQRHPPAFHLFFSFEPCSPGIRSYSGCCPAQVIQSSAERPEWRTSAVVSRKAASRGSSNRTPFVELRSGVASESSGWCIRRSPYRPWRPGRRDTPWKVRAGSLPLCRKGWWASMWIPPRQWRTGHRPSSLWKKVTFHQVRRGRRLEKVSAANPGRLAAYTIFLLSLPDRSCLVFFNELAHRRASYKWSRDHISTNRPQN